VIRYEGAFALYFNAHNDAPLVWCIAFPSLVAPTLYVAELAVRTVEIVGCSLITCYEPQPLRKEHAGPPSAWLAGQGVVEISHDGLATIRPLGATP
jgi:hypothetical protein